MKNYNSPLIANSRRLISGSGGGGDKGGGGGSQQARQAIEAADNLSSGSNAEVIVLLAEGEIEGIVNGAQGVFLDGTPLQNPDGSFNFGPDTQYWFTNGTPNQAYIPLGNGAAYAVSVGLPIRNGTPVIRTITNLNTNEVRIVINSSNFTEVNNANGDVNGSLVTLKISVNNVPVLQPTIQGKATSLFERQYTFLLPGAGPWDIKVERVTADSNTAYINNTITWASYTGLIHSRLNYPNRACAAFRINATQFVSIPLAAFLLRGMKILIPSNASVDYATGRLSYTGTWDGTFYKAWCACPAWGLYDLIYNGRYGTGAYIDRSQLDKWSFYAVSQYCNELVPTGYSDGSTEARFACNLMIFTQQEALTVLRDFASIFRGMLFFTNNSIKTFQDKPDIPVKVFTNSNVIDGIFKYRGTDLKAIHTTAEVQWNDPTNLYKAAIEYVSLNKQLVKYGVRPLKTIGYGCTSRGQAHRYGLWQLVTEWLEDQAVTFTTGPEGALVELGQLIQIFDTSQSAGVRWSGRIKNLDPVKGVVYLDAPVTLANGKQYQLYVSNPNPTVQVTGTIPATGSATVNVPVLDFLRDGQTVRGRIRETEGFLTRNSAVYTFERIGSGVAYSIAADFVSDVPSMDTQPVTNPHPGFSVAVDKIFYGYGWRRNPEQFSVWAVEELQEVPKLYRLMGRKENPDGSFDFEAVISDQSKYALVEQLLSLNPTFTPVARRATPQITGVDTSVTTYNPAGSGAADSAQAFGTGGILGDGAPPLIPPLAPTINGIFVNRDNLTIRLTWIVPDASTRFIKIYRNENNAGFVLFLQLLVSSSWVNVNVPAGASEQYYILAVNDAGNSTPSNTVSATMPLVQTAPVSTTVTGVGQTGSSNPELAITWSNVASVAYWEINRDGAYWTTVGGTTFGITDTTVDWGRWYTYYVHGCNAGGCAPYSLGASGLTRARPAGGTAPAPTAPWGKGYTKANTPQFDVGPNTTSIDLYYHNTYPVSPNPYTLGGTGGWVFAGNFVLANYTYRSDFGGYAINTNALTSQDPVWVAKGVGPGGKSGPSNYQWAHEPGGAFPQGYPGEGAFGYP